MQDTKILKCTSCGSNKVVLYEAYDMDTYEYYQIQYGEAVCENCGNVMEFEKKSILVLDYIKLN